MKSVTASVDDEIYRLVRIKAAQWNISVSATVGGYLREIANTETESERLKRQQAEARATIKSFNASDRLSRDELYKRR